MMRMREYEPLCISCTLTIASSLNARGLRLLCVYLPVCLVLASGQRQGTRRSTGQGSRVDLGFVEGGPLCVVSQAKF